MSDDPRKKPPVETVCKLVGRIEELEEQLLGAKNALSAAECVLAVAVNAVGTLSRPAIADILTEASAIIAKLKGQDDEQT